MRKDAEERKLYRMANVYYILEIWQGSQKLHDMQKEDRAIIKQMTAVGYISEVEVFVKASRSLIEHDGAASFQLSEQSPLPPALSSKYCPGGRTHMLNVCSIRRINHHPVGRDEDSGPEGMLDPETWLNWIGHLDNPNHTEDDSMADSESDIQHNNGIEYLDCPQRQDVSAALTGPGLVCPTPESKRHAGLVLPTLNAIETRRN